MDDLRRTVWKATAAAECEQCCPFYVEGVWPEQAGKRARKHTRETGHTTRVRYEHTTEYQADQ
jgi:hypothetical protein